MKGSRLLARAIRSLAEPEQEAVLAYLLDRALIAQPVVEPSLASAPPEHPDRMTMAAAGPFLGSPVPLQMAMSTGWERRSAAVALRALASGVAVDQLASDLQLDADTLRKALIDLARRSASSQRLSEVLHRLAAGATIAQAAEDLDLAEAQVAAELEPTDELAGALAAAVMGRSVLPAELSGGSAHGPLRTMPVRFPEPQYQRLKHWSEEHNFPMAVVVRGLVERFLDEQSRRP